MAKLALLPTVDQLNSKNSGEVVGKRQGVLIHFDDSTNDKWAVAWFRDPRCKVSYNRLYLDNGDIVSVCAMTRRAWHAGVCLTKDANSAYYGLSAATDARTPVAPLQFGAMMEDAARLFRHHGWGPSDVETRLVGHDEQAIFSSANTRNQALWGKLGRKIDPTGFDKAHPIIDMDMARRILAQMLS